MLAKEGELICSQCGVIGEPDQIGLGLLSGLVAVFGAIVTMVGLALFVVPGLIFGILTAIHILYFLQKNGVECRHCLAKNSMVPTNTPTGLSVLQKFDRLTRVQAQI